MSFEPNTLFPGLLSESALRVAQDASSRPVGQTPASTTRDMGWNAVLIPQDQGGAGGDFQDLAAIVEALATHVVNLPVITRSGIVPALLNTLREQPATQAILTDIAEGTAVVELAGPLSRDESTPPLKAQRTDQGWQLSGSTTACELTDECTHVLLIASDVVDGSLLVACTAIENLQAAKSRYLSMDERPVIVFDLDQFTLPDPQVIANGQQAAQAIYTGWRIAVAGMATDSVCCMGSALSRTITYLQQRKQFGQALADFQALRHDVARLYISYELSRGLLLATLRTLEQPPGTDHDTSALDLLGLYLGQEAIRFSESVIQLHGGMGMTREMPVARLATRLIANALRFGDPLTYHQKIHNLRLQETQ